jgi:hypothetical protein
MKNKDEEKERRAILLDFSGSELRRNLDAK